MHSGKLLLVLAIGLGAAVARADEPPARKQLTESWMRLAATPNDPASKETLLAGGEPALDALLDILYGPFGRGSPEQLKKLDALVAKLGDAEFAVRESASKELRQQTDLYSLLTRHANHSDPEVCKRVGEILEEVTPNIPAADRQRLLEPATLLLETDWPLDQLKTFARKNLDRLALVETVEHVWSYRPISPILASLRHSPDRADRNLLGEFALKARPGAAVVALGLFNQGLKGRTHIIADHFRKQPPAHDYRAVALACLDPTRPAVYRQAMYAALGEAHRPGKDVVERIHATVGQLKDEKLVDEVWGFLWHFARDEKAFDYFVGNLKSPDREKFEDAVHRLTDPQLAYQGKKIIPLLRPALRGDDASRRLIVLHRLDSYLGQESTILAADEAAPFLISTLADERNVARKVLLELQRRRWLDVLGHVAGKHPDEKVRAVAAELRDEWARSERAKKP
jgi:hypothetical protein